MKLVLLIFFTELLTENHTTISNSIETTKHEMSTEVSSTTNRKIATIDSTGSSSEYKNYSIESSTSVKKTTEEVLIRKITMTSIQIVIYVIALDSILHKMASSCLIEFLLFDLNTTLDHSKMRRNMLRSWF